VRGMVPDKLYQVTILPSANDRMYDHFFFLANVNIKAAEHLLSTLAQDMQSLERMPQRGSLYKHAHALCGEYRYILSAYRYRIVYLILDDCVYIEDIQDCRQNNDGAEQS
jgi:plasmid stabilization system protein ParE